MQPPQAPNTATETKVLLLLAAVILLATMAAHLSHPIQIYDTDLWYHMSGGRHLAATGEIQDDTSFSFIAPERSFTNYYWLFQAVVYGVHSLGGYFGLLVLRAVLGGLLAASVLLLLTPWDSRPPPAAPEEQRRLWNRRLLWGVVWSAVVVLAVFPRFLNVRPHIVSYLMVAVFLLVLEKRPRWSWTLVPLGVLWANIHGIVYPLTLTLLGAYAADYLWERLPARRPGQSPAAPTSPQPHFGRSWPLWFAAACATVLATPHFTALLDVPFTVAQMGEYYIGELARLDLLSMAAIDLFPPRELTMGLSFLAVVAPPVALGYLLFTRQARPSQVILLAAAIVLLYRYRRFLYEYIIMCTPILAAGLDAWCSRTPAPGRRLLRLGMAGALVLLVALGLLQPFRGRPHYPFSDTQLPAGTMAFMAQKAPAGSKLLHVPNYGGYIQWRIAPEHKLYCDLQMSLFTEFDTFSGLRAFQDPVVMGRLLDAYAPDFVLYSSQAGSPEVLEQFDQLVPVFFDLTGVLFANVERQPELAREFDITDIDPFNVTAMDFESLTPEQAAGVRAMVDRMLEIAPHENQLNHVAGQLAIRLRDLETARTCAAVNLKYHPETHSGYFIMGQAALMQQQWQAALDWFSRALEHAGDAELQQSCRRNIYIAGLKAGKYEQAYEALLAAEPPYAGTTTYKYLYELALGAAAAGKMEYSRVFFRFALLTTPAIDPGFQQNILDAMERLGLEDLGPVPGVGSQAGPQG